MSPLAFDKQGKPFAWNPRTRKLKVRLFRNPAARGTCCQVLDGAGAPLYVDADADYAEFRRAISNVPGFYRLDQCDEDCVDIEGTSPAYVSIEHVRNAQSVEGAVANVEVNPLVVIQSMAAIQADVMKTLATQQAQLMAATAEIMRAPYRPALPALGADYRNALDDDEEDDEEVEAKNEILGMIGPMLPTLGEKFGEQIGKRLIDAVAGMFSPKAPAQADAPVATPASMPVTYPTPSPKASRPHVVHGGVATGPSAMSAEPYSNDPVLAEDFDFDAAVVAEVATPGEAAGPSLPADAPTLTPHRDAAVPPATAEQMMHLIAISHVLSPTERTRAERVIASMTPEVRSQWICALATKSIDDAAAEIRAVLSQLQATKR